MTVRKKIKDKNKNKNKINTVEYIVTCSTSSFSSSELKSKLEKNIE
jgi:hypothetical protein